MQLNYNMKKLILFFLLVTLLLEIIISVDSQSPALLKNVLQWPPTFCIQLNSKEKSLCKEPIPQRKFTLHGVMQANEEGYNIKCDYGKEPNWDELFKVLRDQLVTFWPSLREDFNETEFWKHEWRAHGSCGGTTPEEYFYTAIIMNTFFAQGNLYNYLETSGIIASDDLAYTKEQIVEATQKMLDDISFLNRKPNTKSLLRLSPPPPPPPPSPVSRNIYLACVPIDDIVANNTHVYLSEVTWCTDVEGVDYISCPSQADPASCPKEALIMLPLPKEQKLDPSFAIMAE